MKPYIRVFAMVVVAVVTLISSVSKTSAGDRNPGTHRGWRDVDEVTILRSFQLKSYGQVTVTPLDTRGAALPPQEKNTYPLAKEALTTCTQNFAEELREKLSGTKVEAGGASGVGTGLVVRGRVLKMDPGSKAVRMWAGFGAGSAQVQISGEVLDAATKQVLLRFTQERGSSAKTIFQHDSVLTSRSIKQIGADVAGLLKEF